MLTRYATFFGLPGVTRFALFAFLARLPMGTLGIATLLHVRELTGSIAFAGSFVGAQMIAMAVMAPVFGRIIDRRGPRGILLVTAIMAPLAVLLVFFAGPLGLSRGSLLVAAIVTGAFMPPIPTLIRTIWRYRFDDESMRRTAYAVDSVSIELSFTLGPALVGLLVAAASARAAHGLAWLCVVTAVPLLYASRGLPWWKRPAPSRQHLLGPLRQRNLLVIYAATFALTMCFGALEVGYPGFGAANGSVAWGPILIAICSVGSALGGLAYGGMHLSTPVERQITASMLLLAVPLALHMVAGAFGWMAGLAFMAGLMIAPSLTGVTLLVSRYAPQASLTEAFTWSQTAIVTGVAVGMAAGGWLVEHAGYPTAFALGTAAALGAAAFALALPRPHIQRAAGD